MTTFAPKIVAIAGAGTMGTGIAQVFLQGGCKVVLYDLSKETLEKAERILKSSIEKAISKGKASVELLQSVDTHVSFTQELSDVKADLIIEAIIEDVTIKGNFFREVQQYNSEETVYATNTSSIPVTQLAQYIDRQEYFLGIHFFNPAHIMKLVEVVSGVATAPDLAPQIQSWLNTNGKMAVLAKDSPGFIVNRVARSFYTESLLAAEQGAASVEQIDRLMESTGFKMGPFRLMDLIGVDANNNVTKTMYEQFYHETRFRPVRLQQKMVDAGLNGRKSGKGFYEY